mmetsp:Transcript_3818/g.4230  ORF Transcript_3818/g.4230 Transcript_3818/m.4230 type:complete len:270 (-) Transcript_3818:85-894(-)
MPLVGFGTAALRDPAGALRMALDKGYKLFDSASYTGPWYRSEKPLGAILQDANARRKLFITTKLHPADHGSTAAKKSFETSLENLQTDYIDLYLIHFPECGDWLSGCKGKPQGTWKDSWRVMEDLYKQKKVRAIGVSNFSPSQLRELISFAKIKPHVFQTWIDPLNQAKDLHNICKENNIVLQAYSSLGTQWLARGKKENPVLTNPLLQQLAIKYNKQVAQVVLRWLVQRGIAVIPRSNSEHHIASNLDIFDFKLSPEDMTKIGTLKPS